MNPPWWMIKQMRTATLRNPKQMTLLFHLCQCPNQYGKKPIIFLRRKQYQFHLRWQLWSLPSSLIPWHDHLHVKDRQNNLPWIVLPVQFFLLSRSAAFVWKKVVKLWLPKQKGRFVIRRIWMWKMDSSWVVSTQTSLASQTARIQIVSSDTHANALRTEKWMLFLWVNAFLSSRTVVIVQ